MEWEKEQPKGKKPIYTATGPNGELCSIGNWGNKHKERPFEWWIYKSDGSTKLGSGWCNTLLKAKRCVETMLA